MSQRHRIQVIDTHCGGDVSRIVTGGIKRIPGADVREKMEYIKEHGDGLRRLLLSPPYGSPDMSVDLIVEPTSIQADAGYIIMESMGYPGFSGSNTLCTAAALLESGMIQTNSQRQTVYLESPSGVSSVVARIENNQVVSVSCENPDSYIVEHNNTVHLPGFGELTYSIAYSGVFYVLVKASHFGWRFQANEKTLFIETAQRIVSAFQGKTRLTHPVLGDIGSELFVHFMGEVSLAESGLFESRSATFVQPDVLCHSTTGTGTCARLALMHLEHAIEPNQRLRTIAINGSSFVGTITDETQIGPFKGIKCTVTGAPQILFYADLLIDLDSCSVPRYELESILC